MHARTTCQHYVTSDHYWPLMTQTWSPLPSLVPDWTTVTQQPSLRNLDKLQKVQNQLARVVLQLPWSASATEARPQLHWLLVRQRINFQNSNDNIWCDAIWTAGVSLEWTWRLVANTQFRFGCRSIAIHRPHVNNVFSSRAFSVSAPTVCNLLQS